MHFIFCRKSSVKKILCNSYVQIVIINDAQITHNSLEETKNYEKDISQQLQGYCNANTLHDKPLKIWNKKKMENG